MLKTSKPTQEPAQSGRGGDGRGGEGVNKVLQPAQSVRLKASIMISIRPTNCRQGLKRPASFARYCACRILSSDGGTKSER